MGSVVTQALMEAIGGKGNVVMTQGALGHSGAQGRAKGFKQVVANLSGREGHQRRAGRLGRDQGGAHRDRVTKNPESPAAFFHNDDMALAAHNVMEGGSRGHS